MIELVRTLGIAGAAAVAFIFLIRDVLGPLVKYTVEKKTKASDEGPRKGDRVTVLEVNLSNLTTQVVKLETALGAQTDQLQEFVDERAVATDNKLDMVLAELAELRKEHTDQTRMLGERIARVEENVRHLERTRR